MAGVAGVLITRPSISMNDTVRSAFGGAHIRSLIEGKSSNVVPLKATKHG